MIRPPYTTNTIQVLDVGEYLARYAGLTAPDAAPAGFGPLGNPIDA